MKIFIISYKRGGQIRQRFSAGQMPESLLSDVTLVVREEEREEYEGVIKELHGGKIAVHGFEPPAHLYRGGLFSAAGTYDYVIDLAIERGLERIILMDDDLVFTDLDAEGGEFSWDALLEKMAGADIGTPVYSIDCGLDPLPPEGEWSDKAHIARFYCLYLPFFKENPRHRFTAVEGGDWPRYQPDYWMLCRLYEAGFNSKRYNRMTQEHVIGAPGGENMTGRDGPAAYRSWLVISRHFPYIWAEPEAVKEYAENWHRHEAYGGRMENAAAGGEGEGGSVWAFGERLFMPGETTGSLWAAEGEEEYWVRFWDALDAADEDAARFNAVMAGEIAAGRAPAKKPASARLAEGKEYTPPELSAPFKRRASLRLTAHLADHCNLNCAGCDHFSPLAGEKFESAQALERDFERLAELMGDRMGTLELLGGEPLLHPDLIKILDAAGRHFSKAVDLRLITNGTLLMAQPDEFWDACKRNNCKITATRYPVGTPYGKAREKAEKHGAVFQYFETMQRKPGRPAIKARVNGEMNKLPLDPSGRQNGHYSFKFCGKGNECPALKDGKIYPCSAVPYIGYFNKHFGTDIKAQAEDCIDIYEAKSADEVFDFLRKPAPFCRYCDVKRLETGIPWARSKKDVSEWV